MRSSASSKIKSRVAGSSLSELIGTVWTKERWGLTRLYAQELKVRALDILHVAQALELGVRSFWTFDLRQKKLAERVGFKVGQVG